MLLLGKSRRGEGKYILSVRVEIERKGESSTAVLCVD